MNTCWHCGESIPPHVNLKTTIGGVDRAMCCAGCEMVANLIHDAGLERYYDFRDALPERPEAIEISRENYLAWDREAVLCHYTKTDCNDISSVSLVLENIHCSACSWLIQRFIGTLPGVQEISVDIADGRALIKWDKRQTPLGDIAYRLAQLGYPPHLDSPEASADRNQVERRLMLKRMVVAGLGMMQVMSYALAGYIGAFQDIDEQTARFFQLVSMLVAVPVSLYAGQGFFRSAWNTLKHRRLGMDVPVALALLVALSASIFITLFGSGETYFDSVVMFIFFLLVGRYAVMVTRQNAGQLHSALARSLPNQVTRVLNGKTQEVGLIELEVGDYVEVGLGETIPADGQVVEGEASVDEALLSGESKPRERHPGDFVLAGTQLTRGRIVLEIEKIGQDTALSEVVRLLDRARHFKPRAALMADQIAGWFIAFVLVGAITAGWVWWQVSPSHALPIMLSVLVVSCPCALALGTPVALASAARGFGRLGLLINHPDSLEVLPKVTHVILDKTGTLTLSQMALVRCLAPNHEEISEHHFGAIAGRLERVSRHPIATAFRSLDDGGGVQDAEEIVHQGVQGTIDGRKYYLGKPEFIANQLGVAAQPPNASAWLALADEEGLLAWFELDNPTRAGARDLIATLQMKNLTVWIASGDQEAPVQALATQLGIDHFQSQCSPEQKLLLVQELQRQGGCVAMIGDGINDAPVLAGADVSLTLAEGADIARTQADVVMTGSTLESASWAFVLAPKVRNVIQQNLLWAISYNALAFPLAALGLVPPWAAAIGMSASSLLVVMNGRRAGQITNHRHTPGSPAPAKAQNSPLAALTVGTINLSTTSNGSKLL